MTNYRVTVTIPHKQDNECVIVSGTLRGKAEAKLQQALSEAGEIWMEADNVEDPFILVTFGLSCYTGPREELLWDRRRLLALTVSKETLGEMIEALQLIHSKIEDREPCGRETGMLKPAAGLPAQFRVD